MADLNQAGLEAMKDSIKNVKVYVEQVDITDAKACEEFVANVAKEFGRIDVLCNNAGTGMMGDLLTFPEEVFRKHADLMMYAPIRLMNLLIVSVPILLPKVTKDLLLTSFAIGGVLVGLQFGFQEVHYLSLTAFEMSAFILVFTWLVLLFNHLEGLLIPEKRRIELKLG